MKILPTLILGLLIFISTTIKAEYSQMQKRIDEKEKLIKEDQNYYFPRLMNQTKEKIDEKEKDTSSKEDCASKKSSNSIKSN